MEKVERPWGWYINVKEEKEQFKNKEVGIIISGGNVDVANLPF